MTATVVHIRDGVGYDVYIGRGSKWGNPFKIGRDGNRGEVIDKYAEYLIAHPRLVVDALYELQDKRLACFCAPKPCHGDLLVGLVSCL